MEAGLRPSISRATELESVCIYLSKIEETACAVLFCCVIYPREWGVCSRCQKRNQKSTLAK